MVPCERVLQLMVAWLPLLYTHHVSDNRIGDEGAKAIGEGMKSCPSLQTLHLYSA